MIAAVSTPEIGILYPGRILRSLFLAIVLLFASCGGGGESLVAEGPASHEDFARQIESNGLNNTIMGQRWLDAANAALTEPLPVVLPYAESGGFLAHNAGAQGLMFEAMDGQTLHLQFNRRGEPGGRVYVELFYAREPLAEARHVRLRGLGAADSKLELELPYDGQYIVRLQPELLVDVLYDLRLELDAAVPFPVQVERNAVGSFFGDPRDAGSRLHEGIDIFAPRNTPVVAVAAGRAHARTTQRGGNVVWLRTADRSYYYAHLEKAAFSGRRFVEAGKVLGYVGNSGNAITTPTHLHFGVYRRGHGAMDPLPRLAARVFEQPPETLEFPPRHVRTHAGKLNLRAAPDTSSDVLEQLNEASIVKASAVRGEWLRVTTPWNVSGWIHRNFQEEVSSVGRWQAGAPTVLLDSLNARARPAALVRPDEEFDVIGSYATHLLLRSADGETEGWLAGPLAALPGPKDATIVVASGGGDADAASAAASSGGSD
jgi:murein DD-endopeptidase MepM/ murein hydrolase activator NlpD